MKVRLLVLVALALFAVQMPVSAQSTVTPVEPVAHTPDAEKVMQSSLSQGSVVSVPVSMVFTEYTFADAELALNYFHGICAFLETDMAEISPEGMAYLDLPQDKNPTCGFARMKGTQATSATVYEERVLTVWAFGPGFSGSVGEFMETFMRAATPIVDEAKLPDPKKVDRPWKVETHDVDITSYATTPYELRG